MIASLRIGHPPLERLRAFAVGDLAPRRRARVAAHLEQCQRCRQRIATMRAVVSVAREDFAPPAPPGALEQILARRAGGERRILPPAQVIMSQVPRALPGRSWARAAGFALAITFGTAGVAAALVPQVRGWLAALAGGGANETVARPPVRRDPGAGSPRANSVAAALPVTGAAIEVHAESLWVAVTAADPDLRLRVRLTGEPQLEVRGIGPTADARFSPRADGIGVMVSGAGELQLEVPRAARHVVIRVNGEPWLIKEHDQFRVRTPRADTVGAELLLTPEH